MDSNTPQDEMDVEGHKKNFRIDGPEPVTDDVDGHMARRMLVEDDVDGHRQSLYSDATIKDEISEVEWAEDVEGHRRNFRITGPDADDVEGHKKNFR